MLRYQGLLTSHSVLSISSFQLFLPHQHLTCKDAVFIIIQVYSSMIKIFHVLACNKTPTLMFLKIRHSDMQLLNEPWMEWQEWNMMRKTYIKQNKAWRKWRAFCSWYFQMPLSKEISSFSFHSGFPSQRTIMQNFDDFFVESFSTNSWVSCDMRHLNCPCDMTVINLFLMVQLTISQYWLS